MLCLLALYVAWYLISWIIFMRLSSIYEWSDGRQSVSFSC